jgi:peptidoglycan-associated lipoprotein
MPLRLTPSRALRLAAALSMALGAAACSNSKDLSDASGAFGAGAATPGSAQDFVVNVGDRVFFESDQTDLTPVATATLDKQAAWLQRYPRYTFIIEGHADERGTREYNFSLGARRAAPSPCATTSPRAGSAARACARCPTARSARWPCATTSRAGRRTAAR